MIEVLKKSYGEAIASNKNVFDTVESNIAEWYDSPCHDFGELKRRQNKKIRGDLFEEFCVSYLKVVGKYENAWLLQDVPEDILKKLNMVVNDLGIDIVCEKNGQYSAVQVKYRKKTGKKRILSWKLLSTFYALCLKTGPWSKYIVMTNCDYIRGVGKKTSKDQSICLRSFQNISTEHWTKMCQFEGHSLNMDETKTQEDEKTIDNIEFVRQARLIRFG